MKEPPSIEAVDVPGVGDVFPGGTERLVRSILGDEVADRLDRKYPGRIDAYCDTVRLMISTLYSLGAVDGEPCRAVQFPDELLGLDPEENHLLLEGLVEAGCFTGSAQNGYRLTRGMFLHIDPAFERTQ
jgi:hypothetical protein